jgi:hypothetical protein
MIAERTRLEVELADLGLTPMPARGRRLDPVPRGIDQSREFEGGRTFPRVRLLINRTAAGSRKVGAGREATMTSDRWL